MRGVTIIPMVLLCGPASAGLIFGSINVNDQPLRQHDLSLACARDSYPGKTNENGSYSINAPETGRCTLVINYSGNDATFDVFSEKKPLRYDLQLIREGNRWILRRR